MTIAVDCPQPLSGQIASQEHVIRVQSVLRFMTRDALRWQIVSGRWQKPCRGIVVAHSGPITERQRLWIALLAAGREAVLAGLTAAKLDSFKRFADSDEADGPIYLLLPAGQPIQRKPPGPPVVVHYSTALGPDDVHPVKQPRRTRIARSLVDAAAWMPTDRGAQAVLAAGVQQRLVRVVDLATVTTANQRIRRRKLITATLDDIAGGAEALSELDFTRLVIRGFELPEPSRQRRRQDSTGRNRYLDAVWDKERLVVEIDGAQHMDPAQYWDDMSRDNELTLDGYTVLRFPAWMVRHHPAYVAARIRKALRKIVGGIGAL